MNAPRTKRGVIRTLRAQLVMAADAVIALREAERDIAAGLYPDNGVRIDHEAARWASGALQLSRRYALERAR